MALPSQMQSSPVRGRYVYRRRRRKRGPAVLIGVLVAIGLGLWLSLGWFAPASSDAPGDSTGSQPASTSYSSWGDSVLPPRTTLIEQPVAAAPRWIPAAEPPPARDIPGTSVATDSTALPAASEIMAAAEVESAPAVSVTITHEDGPLGLAGGLVEGGQLIEARALLTQAIDSGAMYDTQIMSARAMLGQINDELVFGPHVYPGDPWASDYTVKPGDNLSTIVSRENLKVDWRLLQWVNGMETDQIQAGQNIKILHGPFHAEIDKSTHRLDLYMGEGPERAFVRSYDVGLGALDSTPLGRFQVRKGHKIVNPTWINPRTGEFYPADDPENPIGEFWMGLQGIDATNSGERGFGIHGTIDPGSIGTDSSLGCVRLQDGEIDMIYAVMAEGVSTIDVRR